MEGDTKPEDVPSVTEDIGVPTLPSPGRLPPPHLPPPEPGKGEPDEAAPPAGSGM